MTRDPLPTTLLVLTFVTGLVDAVSFLGLGHVFTANMTGNVVFLGFATVGAPGLSISRSLTSLGAFFVGAAVGGWLSTALAATERRRWLLATALAEAMLLLVAAVESVGFDIESASPASRLYAAIVLTAVAMGLRNATVRRLAVPDLTTTVLTLTLTGLAAESAVAGGDSRRLGRRVASVLAMFTGAAIGALLLRRGVALSLAVSGAGVLTAAVPLLWLPAAGTGTSAMKTAG
jgi:uncharacterized membrane protein YoaK (UPF0700 family)